MGFGHVNKCYKNERNLAKKLKAEGNFEDAKSYEEKLTAMRNRAAVEEDFVWRTRPNLSKQL